MAAKFDAYQARKAEQASKTKKAASKKETNAHASDAIQINE